MQGILQGGYGAMHFDKGRSAGLGLKHARQMLERGDLPEPGAVNEMVVRSWQRCMKAGLLPFGKPADVGYLVGDKLEQAQHRRRQLLARAKPVLDYLHAQSRGSGSLVLLADEDGVILESLGDPEFVSRAERVALMSGASWNEVHRGTNAIGTALSEKNAVTVHGGEHFLESNSFLTCTASPLLGPDGQLQGVLDISGHWRLRQSHTSGLVLTGAHMIENRLFERRHGKDVWISIHPSAEGIGTIAEGLVALNEEGRILGANRAGMALLKLFPSDLGRSTTEGRIDLRMEAFLDWGRRRAEEPMAIRRCDGATLFLKVRLPQTRMADPAVANVSPKPNRDALERLDTGDQRMERIIEQARKILDKRIPILLFGETGVGKEVFAKAMHASSRRMDKPFVAINCAALPEHLIESELFGYAPGAFTGARREGWQGRIREANGGTLFLDEIGDMPLALQSRLLRLLQEGEVIPLGGGKPAKVDFQLIAASHRQLTEEVEKGRFRADLYYRLDGITLHLPALRERSDFQILAARILDDIAPNSEISLAPELAKFLASLPWPGNLRQMSHVLRTSHAMLENGETRITREHLPGNFASGLDLLRHAPHASVESLRETSDAMIMRALKMNGGNRSESARRLGISRSTLYRKMRRLAE